MLLSFVRIKIAKSFHDTNWKNQNADSKLNDKMDANWLIHRDSIQYAYDKYHKCAQYVLTGASFMNKNWPPLTSTSHGL